MSGVQLADPRVGEALRAVEESVEAVNFLAMEMVVGALESGATVAELSAVGLAADRAACATGEMARLLRETGIF